MSKCNENDLSKRGPDHPQQQAYQDTVADYSTTSPDGDNVKEDVPCDASVAVGDVVRMNGTTAVRAVATSFANSNAVGIVISKPTATTCDIAVCGPVTLGALSPLDTGEQYFLSDTTSGALTDTPPTTSGNYVIRIGNAINNTTITLKIERVVKRA